MQIIHNLPHAPLGRRILRALAGLVGAVLTIAGLIAAAPPILFIETLKRHKDVRPVFVGQLNRIEQLKKGTNLGGSLAETGPRLRSLLTDEAVLVYESEDNKAMRYFAANLSARLEML